MKWTGIYFLGYVILMGGMLAALWKLGVLKSIGTFWTGVGIVIRRTPATLDAQARTICASHRVA